MSTINTSRGVPGIPLGALDAISDENTRLVLQAVVDGLNVRNGASGTGDMAFVTRAELDGSQSALSIGLNRQIGDYTEQVRRITPGMISQVINDLQAQIMESKLFKDLGERVSLIDRPGGIFERLGETEKTLIEEQTLRISGDEGLSQRINVMGVRVGTAEAAISTETTQRVNADNAIQQTISTQYAAVNNNLSLLQTSQTTTANNVAALTTTMQQVQAQVGANAVAIQQETQARAAADGTLYAQWTLRVDVGGRVSGFGLASNQSVSDFIVRADRFSIASPSTQDGMSPQMPFIVKTTGNGVGVYIRNTFIEDASITSAKIRDAEVNTLKIAGNAVTVPSVVSAITIYYGAGLNTWIRVAKTSIYVDISSIIYASSTGFIGYGKGWRMARTRLLINGVIVSAGEGDSGWVNAAHSGALFCNAGYISAELQFSGADSLVRCESASVFMMAAKR